MSARQDITKDYRFNEIEEKWLNTWDKKMYFFDESSKKDNFIIDTPPPYPTGDFHIGNGLNWSYIDFIARYKRMNGFNVMFPQGWDCHGLPTEVKVEETYNITKKNVGRDKFRQLCEDLTLKNISQMKKTMIRLGYSIDWSKEYITMFPKYYKKTQISFVKMYNKGLIYREEHPVNYCPRCGTAIAFAEVEYTSQESKLNFIKFDIDDEKEDLVYILIATTRPELLSACVAVAVNPSDDKNNYLIGKKVKVPLFGHKVEVIGDNDVDPEFGTGIVMICTFGDKNDVRWWKKHSLDLRRAIDLNGRMTAIAGKYEGLTIEDCRKAIINDLKKEGLLVDERKIEQSIGCCWRCNTPIEIFSEVQWFMQVESEKVSKMAESIEWIPEYMLYRLKNWAESMEWDWCISRQRVFATPLPVWYCKNCGEIKVSELDWLPLDPTNSKPKTPCSRCGSTEFIGEEDVLDTWMDSSLSAVNVAGWDGYNEDRLKPLELRPQGHDIIRTWAFYTILRTMELTGKKPWNSIFINGMVLGEDGYKMSKSRGNVISPEEIIGNYGADTFRLWAASAGRPGSDILFRWDDVKAASRFLRKLWNVFRFCIPHLKNCSVEDTKIASKNVVDLWLLSELHEVVVDIEEDMKKYRFDEVIKEIRSFVWGVFADNYIEMVKHRLYYKNDKSAVDTIRTTLKIVSRLLAPFAPFISEEIYSNISSESVHIQPYPHPYEVLYDKDAYKRGSAIKDVIKEVRRYKSDSGIPLNREISSLKIYDEEGLLKDEDLYDIEKTVNSREIKLYREKPNFGLKVVDVIPNMKKIGQTFKGRSKSVVELIKKEKELGRLEKGNKITIEVDEQKIEIDDSYYQVKEEYVTEDGVEIKLLFINDKITVAVLL
ncbi:MAG: valine--tRNA ligase [Candidatus Methanoliparum thermophilum]|uniref:Valine--tRNA ligase n=1 Tax=Methanoliparum thermophilum TaxID=2491083 RepID=A0A520KSH1_METT2|nr:MAG: valine--tRNA ligase [Candidatus Methanoliparum thermophilum]